MIHSKNKKKEGGFVASLSTLLVLVFMLSVAMSMSVLIFGRQKISTNTINATQSYYTAEAGIEDSLMRLKSNPQMSPVSYTLAINNSTADVVIPAIVGSSRSISSQGTNNNLIKTIQVIYSPDSQGVSFYYGLEIGEGGLVMNNGSEVLGNVFSGGNISGSGSAKIDNNAIVSGNGHSITGVYVGQDAFAYSCLSGSNVGNLTYVTGGTNSCTVRGTTTVQSDEISEQPLPIPQSQIDDWKAEAVTACDSGAVTDISSNNKSVTMGPCKITGNLDFGNHIILTLTGTIYVTGDVTLHNTNTVKLSSSYGFDGGVLLSDGIIDTGNSNVFTGSGQTGSYLMFLSTKVSNPAISDPAIIVSNGSTGAVFYTNNGEIKLSNNVSALELTGYKVTMEENSKIEYSNGVVNIFFSGGPSGGWKVTSWQEQ